MFPYRMNPVCSSNGSTGETSEPICLPEEDVGLRYYWLQRELEDIIRNLTDRELQGATEVITALHSFLDRVHFQEKRVLNRRALVKTIEELFEICTEEYIHREVPEEEEA